MEKHLAAVLLMLISVLLFSGCGFVEAVTTRPTNVNEISLGDDNAAQEHTAEITRFTGDFNFYIHFTADVNSGGTIQLRDGTALVCEQEIPDAFGVGNIWFRFQRTGNTILTHRYRGDGVSAEMHEYTAESDLSETLSICLNGKFGEITDVSYYTAPILRGIPQLPFLLLLVLAIILFVLYLKYINYCRLNNIDIGPIETILFSLCLFYGTTHICGRFVPAIGRCITEILNRFFGSTGRELDFIQFWARAFRDTMWVLCFVALLLALIILLMRGKGSVRREAPSILLGAAIVFIPAYLAVVLIFKYLLPGIAIAVLLLYVMSSASVAPPESKNAELRDSQGHRTNVTLTDIDGLGTIEMRDDKGNVKRLHRTPSGDYVDDDGNHISSR